MTNRHGNEQENGNGNELATQSCLFEKMMRALASIVVALVWVPFVESMEARRPLEDVSEESRYVRRESRCSDFIGFDVIHG